MTLSRFFMLILPLVLLTACENPDRHYPPEAPFDPYESRNRNVHAFNKSLDRNAVRPVARGYSAAVPDDVETLIGRFSENAALPSYALASLLSGDGYSAGTDLYRFLVNSTFGLAGFFDPATELGVAPASDKDFGHVLYALGFSEGAYFESPFVGPTTVRDTAGRIIGIFGNPLRYVVPSPESLVVTVATASNFLSKRARYSNTIDSVLHDSADSYAQTRLLYLQKRRYELSRGSAQSQPTYVDPYGEVATSAEPGTTTAASTYNDPYSGYEDPYND